MKSISLKGFAFIFLCMFLTSCNSIKYEKSESIPQKEIFQSYFISYNAQTELLTAQAVFYQNSPAGKTLKLSGESQVSFNNEKLDGNKVDTLGYIYQRAFTGKIPGKFGFRYKNNDGMTFNNNIALTLFELPVEKISISKTNPVTTPFNGMGFSEDEDLICNILQNGKEIHSFYPNIFSKSSIQFIPSEIESLQAGIYECYFIRRNSSTNVKSLNRGGLWESEYISKKIQITITE